MKKTDVYSGRDPRGIPAYPISEAARFVGVPSSTLRAWAHGQQGFRRVLEVGEGEPGLCYTFFNLVEAFALASLRREYKLSMQKIRRAMDFIEQTYPGPHPLATREFATDGVDLLIRDRSLGLLVNASHGGQVELERVIKAYLRRIEHDTTGYAAKFYPFTRSPDPEQPRFIVIDPRIQFGRPALTGSGVPVDVIVDRYKAGDPISLLAKDLDSTSEEIEEAIRSALEAA